MRGRSKGKAKPETIDDYPARVSSGQRAALNRLRKAIRAAAPRAEECISYQLPAFRLDGRMLVWFGAGSSHCAIRFQPDRPIPVALVVQARAGSHRTADR